MFIITIIVLLILAGVVINMTLGNEGIIAKSQAAVDIYKNAQEKEDIEIAKIENDIDGYNTWVRTGEEQTQKSKYTLLAETSSSSFSEVTLLNSEKISNYKSFVLALYSNENTQIRATTFISREMLESGVVVYADYWANCETTLQYVNDTSVKMGLYVGSYGTSGRLYGLN